jgi:hypothetical protein
LFPIAGAFTTGTGNSGAGFFYITDLTSGTYTKIVGTMALQAGGTPYQMQCTGAINTTSLNAFKLFFASGNIASGTFSLYGLKES